MKIRVLTNLDGPDFKLVAGDITDRFDDVIARRLIAYGNAEAVAEPTVAAPAVEPSPNRARRPRP